jgi:putative membrane protein
MVTMRSQRIDLPALVFCTVASLVPASLLLAQNPNTPNPSANPNQPNSMNRPMAQNAPIPDTSNSQMQDKVFLHKAEAGGMAEIQFGQLAAQKGNSAEVKQFGQKMVDDHTKLNDEMKPIADQLGVMAPKHLNKADQAEYDKLSSLSGDAFDQEYIAAMVKDHRKDLHEFRMEESATSNPDLKAAISQAEPVISQHLNMIQGIAQQKGVAVPEGHHGGNSGAPPQVQ